jgi:hypothetical protein
MHRCADRDGGAACLRPVRPRWAPSAILYAVVLWGVVHAGSAAEMPQASLVHLDPTQLPGLQAGATQAGVGLVARTATPDLSTTMVGNILCWEARADGELTLPQAQAMGHLVEAGGGLLITVDLKPGTGLMHLGFMLPTTAWNVGFPTSVAGGLSCAVTVQSYDREFFTQPVEGLTMPFCVGIRPVSAVERGQGRYEIFKRTIPKIDITVPAGNVFWTRPLLNRDWRIRLRADDLSATPLLLTGRYGAGRVAVMASSCAGIDAQPQSPAFWKAVFSWLKVGTPREATPPPSIRIAATSADPHGHALQVTLENSGAAIQHIELVSRICSWERAIIADDVQDLAIPANGSLQATVPLPHPGATTYQALDARDAFVVRLGVLSHGGEANLAERTVAVDLRPALLMHVSSDDVSAIAYPYPAPGPQSLQFTHRMGTALESYAYKPGQAGTFTVSIGNGSANLAPLATVHDETTPDNPTTEALTDESAFAEKGPIDGVQAHGCWIGKADHDNQISFTFPVPTLLSAVTLVGDHIDIRGFLTHNPAAAVIELDGQKVAAADDLDHRFLAEHGRVRLSFTPVTATTVRLRLPWVATLTDAAKSRRREPWLAEVEIDGSSGSSAPASASGMVQVSLHDALSGETVTLPGQPVSVPPLGWHSVSFPFTAPPGGQGVRIVRVTATFNDLTASTKVMVLDPRHPLAALEELVPPDAPNLGFIVTRGFRNLFSNGTGTRETIDGWGQPDDLVWAYSHQLKQIGKNARTEATRLYVSESDMRHYSTPWRDFPDGIPVYDLGIPGLLEHMSREKSWTASHIAILNHSDRWDSGPQISALHGWQDFVEFDQHLRALGKTGLKGRTREQLATEIHAEHESDWQSWQLDNYLHSLRLLRETFAKAGKQLILRSQGIPLVPAAYEAEIAATIRGMSDDETWGMQDGSVTLSTGRQLAILAFNPSFALSTLLQWGYDSPMCNPIWHSPVGTTEPSRRHYYDRAWRAIVDRSGSYRSMHSYGYNLNAGFSYTMTANDWLEFWRVEERHSLLSPEAPLGVGLVMSTARRSDPAHVAFSGGGEVTETLSELPLFENAYRRFQDQGISIPFSANAGILAKWKGSTPLILLNLCDFSDEEITAVHDLLVRGVHLVAFQGDRTLTAAAATAFGVHADGSPDSARSLSRDETHAITAHDNAVLISGSAAGLSPQQVKALLAIIEPILDSPLHFPAGTSGYGFIMGSQQFLVVEDWREEGRVVDVRLHARPGAMSASACDLNDHLPLTVTRTGADWTIQVPLRPADAALICVEERP